MVSNKSKIYVYTINGQHISTSDSWEKKDSKINCISFIDKQKPYLMVATDLGELIMIDFLRMVEIRNLTRDLFYLDRSDARGPPKSVESQVTSRSINSFMCAEEGKHLYIGYDNGCFAALGKNQEDSLAEFREDLTEIGIDI
mmetsp:Transcript_30694/g.27883  ORF Transcript_30694/g.27883 Transcript_30694/m.27883 type:complete len:142 (+) Transcript_30694:2608-3033(+)